MVFNAPNRIREQQIFFQKPGHTLLYLKGGPKDKAIFSVLVGLIGAGSVICTYKMYLLITGQKPTV